MSPHQKMHSSPSPPFSWLPFLIFLFLFGNIPPSSSSFENGFFYKSCSKLFNCGPLTGVDFPFWGEDRSSDCGHPKFQLNCSNGVATIEIMNVIYRVLDIENNTNVLKIARDDYFGGLCTSKFVSTTLDHMLFDYIPGSTNLTILYGCPPFSTVGYNVSSCRIDGVPYKDVHVLPGAQGPGICNTSVIVPVIGIDWLISGNYVGLDRVLQNDGFEVKWKVANEECSECTRSGGKCGYNPHVNQTTCFCPNELYGTAACTLSPEAEATDASKRAPGSSSSGLNSGLKIIIGVSAAFAGIVVVFIMICCLRTKSVSDKTLIFRKNDQDVDAFLRNHGSLAPKKYSYSDVKKMTNSFIDKLGQGGYGCVYKGKLSDGRLVAVKVLSESKGNGEEFLNEVASISRTSHVNVVNLLGFCYDRSKRALIYEFMPNGSLDRFIYVERSSNTNCHLEWGTLYRIAVCIARGLEYLHSGCNTRILHFDIKPHNILLDEDFQPKISDFGLAKLCQRKESVISMLGARGTIGYIAPEVFSRHFGGVSYKSDVYSYGMMILEMAGGGKKIKAGVSQTSEIYFPHWIYKQLEPGMELKLDGDMTEEEKELARKMILVGLWCIQTKPSDRPSMTKVVEMLEGSIQSLQIPPKPFLSSPPRSPQHYSSTISTLS